jgi:hypothetical protein
MLDGHFLCGMGETMEVLKELEQDRPIDRKNPTNSQKDREGDYETVLSELRRMRIHGVPFEMLTKIRSLEAMKNKPPESSSTSIVQTVFTALTAGTGKVTANKGKNNNKPLAVKTVATLKAGEAAKFLCYLGCLNRVMRRNKTLTGSHLLQITNIQQLQNYEQSKLWIRKTKLICVLHKLKMFIKNGIPPFVYQEVIALQPTKYVFNAIDAKYSLRQAVEFWCSNDRKVTEYDIFGDISDWDTSLVTDMSGLFSSKTEFNDDISRWNVENVVTMYRMFYKAGKFNQNINRWKVSSVRNMASMFLEAIDFNMPLNDWDVSNVEDMTLMFSKARCFNQPLDKWIPRNVTSMSMMFQHALSFNQPLNTWDVSNVVDMERMFFGTFCFNQPLDSWNVANVTNMTHMFEETRSFSFKASLMNIWPNLK